MSFNINGFLNNLLAKAGSISTNLLGKAEDKTGGARQTPSFALFGSDQQSDARLRQLSLNYAPTQTSQTAAPQWKEGAQTDGSYIAYVTPSDVGKSRWSKEIDPADISRAALRKAAVGIGIANNEAEAKQIVDNLSVNGLKTKTNKGERLVDKSDVGFGQWVRQHTDQQGRWAVQAGTNDIASLRESARQLGIGNPDVAVASPNPAKPTQQADAGILAGSALALPKLAQQLPKAAVLAGEAAPPLLIATATVLGAAALVNQHVEVVRSNWEELQKAKLMPLPIPMDDAEPLPLPIPEGKTRPFAEPTAKPKAQDLPSAPTDIVPVPKAKPDATTAQPAAPTIDTDAQPYTPDVPRNNQPQSPQQTPRQPNSPKNLDRVIPPTIVGTAAGKAIDDAVNNQSAMNRTQPSLLPNPNRSAEGIPEKTIPNSVIPDVLRQNEDIDLQNKSADILAQAGYKVKHRHNTPISAEEVKNNPRLKVGKQPDFDIEGKIFDHLVAREGTSSRNLVTRSIEREKIGRGQSTRFVVNLDKSDITFDQLKEQLEKYPVNGLDELIIIKDGKVTPFYPFKK